MTILTLKLVLSRQGIESLDSPKLEVGTRGAIPDGIMKIFMLNNK